MPPGRQTKPRGPVVTNDGLRREQAALQASEERFRLLVETIREVFWLRDRATRRILYVSPSFESVWGRSAADVYREGWSFMENVYGGDRDRVAAARRALYDEGRAFDEEYRLFRSDRSIRWVRACVYPVSDKSGKVTKYVGIAEDISDRKRAEAEIRSRTEEQAWLLKSMMNAFVLFESVFDDDGRFVSYRFIYINSAYERITGVKNEEVKGRTVHEVWPETESSWIEAYGRVAATGRAEIFEMYHGPTGKYYRCHVYRPWDTPARFCVIFDDITERKRTEVMLRASEERHLRQRNALVTLAMGGIPDRDDSSGLHKITETSAWTLDTARSSIWRYNRDRTTIQCLDLYELKEDRHSSGMELSVADCPGYFQAFSEIDVISVPDVGSDPRTRELLEGYLRPLGITSMMDAAFHLNGVMVGVLCHEHIGPPRQWTSDERTFAAAVGNLVSLALEEWERKRAQGELRESAVKLHRMLDGTIKAMISVLEVRDPYTAGHERRVARLASAIGTKLGLSADQVEGIVVAAYVHDIGKIAIPTEILSKPGKLSSFEMSLVRMHPQAGYDIIKDIGFIWPVARMVLQHHERMDGSGYPQGLKGEQIMLEARILAVADVVEAMSSHRPYRPALGIDQALAEIREKKGLLYDPACADACESLFLKDQFRLDT